MPKALVWAEGYVSGGRTLSLARWYPAWRWAETDAQGTATLPRTAAESLSIYLLAPGHPVLRMHLAQQRASIEVKAVSGDCRRRVEVRDPAGRPVAGAVLRSPLFVFPEAPGWELGTTGQDGSVTLPVLCGGELQIVVEASGGRRMMAHLPRLAPEASAPPPPVSLPAASRWTGRVLAAGSREPVAGALVWSNQAPLEATRTGARGDFVLAAPLSPAPHPRTSFMLSAAAAGYLEASLEVPAPGGAGAPGPTLLLTPVVRLEGVVVDAADRQVADAEVSAELASSSRDSWLRFREHSTRSDAAGRFLLEVPPQERYRPQYLVQAVREGFAPTTIEIAALEPGAARSDLRLVLHVGRQASGRVLGPGSRPVAGAKVLLIPESPGPFGIPLPRSDSDLSSPPAAWPSASSNPEGRFTLPHVVAGRFDLVVKADGFVPFTRRGVSVAEGEGAADLGTVVLDPGVTLEGIVVDVQGRPIAGAAVDPGEAGNWLAGLSSLRRLSDAAVRTGPDGRFRLQNLSRDQAIDLTVSHEGHTPARMRQVTLPAVEPLRIVLQPAARVSGRVVNDRGEPVRGAEVSAFAAAQVSSSPVALATGRSGPDGAFRLDVEAGQILVGARAGGLLPSELLALDVLAGRETENLVLQVRPGAIVEGRVTGADGHPLAGAEVRQETAFGSLPYLLQSSGWTRTDGEGRYRLEGVAPGPATFEVEHGRSARASRELDVQPGINRLDVQMPSGTAVSGRVLDAEGRPVEGAQVMLGREQTLSGADGGFRFSSVAPGSYSLGAFKSGLPGAELAGIEVRDAPVHNLELRFARGSAIMGKILGLSARQLSDVVIMAARPHGGASGKVDAGRAEYRIDGVIPGDWTLLVAAPDLGLVRRTVAVPPDGSDVVFDLDLGKPEGLTLSGRIVRAGQPIAGAMVMVSGEDVDGLGMNTSAADGTFRIASLAPGRYRLSVSRHDPASLHSETVELAASREIVVELPTAKVNGQVALPDGSPAAGAEVELRPPGDPDYVYPRTRTAVTDAAGAFVLGDAAPGSYRITADKKGYARAEAAVEVPENGDVEGLQLRLAPAAELVVELRGPGGNGPPFVFTALVDEAGRTVAASREVPDEAGRIQLRSAPAGRFLLVLSSPGFATTEAPVTVPGGDARIDLAAGTALRVTVPELVRQGLHGTLTVTLSDGRPFRALESWGTLVQQWRSFVAGSFNLQGLPAGAWKLRVTAPDGKVWEKDVTTAEAVAGTIEAVLED